MRREEAEQFLVNTLKKDKLASAYIIYGGSPEERERAALFFSGRILCAKGPSCQGCLSCEAAEKKQHPDARWIYPSKSVLSIEDVREMRRDAYLKPYSSSNKVYILEAAYIKDEAANAFLKILEEPPQYVAILLISPDINRFLPTIISRCQRIRLNYRDLQDSGEVSAARDEFEELFSALLKGRHADFFKGIEALVKEKGREGVESWLGNVLYLCRNSFIRDAGFDSAARIVGGPCPESVSARRLIDMVFMEKLVELKSRIRYNVNLKLGLQALFCDLLSRDLGPGDMR